VVIIVTARRSGEVIYWTATLIAALIVVVVVVGYVSNAGEGNFVIPIVPLLLAGAIWLVGWACRNVLAGG
jgi:type VI protein secretion system component VasK